jgi:membrane protease YdiL (CAAX protease family)
MQSMLHRLADRRPATLYVLVAYAVTFVFVAAWAALPELAPFPRTLLFVCAGFGPWLAAMSLLWLRGESVRAWLRGILRPGVGWRPYAFAVALPLFGLAVAGGVHAFVLGGTVTPDVLPSPAEYPLYLAVVLFLGGGQEEPGWRGFLLPTLQARYGSLGAALVVGVVWVGWHVPLFLVPEAIQSNIDVWLYAPNVVAISVVLTWLYNRSRGSVLPVALLHAGANAVVNYYPVGGAEVAVGTTAYGLFTTVVVLVAFVLVLRDGPDLGEVRPRPAAGPQPGDD